MMEFKQVTSPMPVDPPGSIRALFATFNVVDRDGDVILPGAIPAGARVPIGGWNHASTKGVQLPIGSGVIVIQGQDAVLEGQLFLSTQSGREAYEVLRALGDLAQWSFGFTVLEAAPGDGREVKRIIRRLEIHEVSPVLVGAGVGTRTLAVKGTTLPIECKGVVPQNVSNELAPEDRPWSAPNLSDFTDQPWNELSERERRRIAGHFAWAAAMPPERYSDLKLPHHDPATGRVVWRGVVAAMAALLGARGGVDIPEDDRRAVYEHLAAHYRQFDREPPALKTVDMDDIATERLTLADHVERVRADAAGVAARMRALAALRAKEGRVLSTANRDRLLGLLQQIQQVAQDLEALLRETEPLSLTAAKARLLALRTRALTLAKEV